jgi:hypothetical protein
MFRNWEYVVLSRVRTLSGLYLVKPIDIDKSFEPSDKLKKYIKHKRKRNKPVDNKKACYVSD